ncbi:hypothetical protein Z517_09268 [Fonsecaea pedrosoi CBS 271.37]|uniref:Uncharacterized protein n=1 Tax=Fonsecaea pedrosoi CBS 271.37 TaxID=1442368 RepID=A0A0D2GWT3_9EURO|nr:uncharacterized protein Z517_09268 [Fonsecaea pedrosoi CBS 271.37]KIW76824.1 hypothetical protein Z517_09268 [Fonsecaea pedrosoi CBS 271.37]
MASLTETWNLSQSSEAIDSIPSAKIDTKPVVPFNPDLPGELVVQCCVHDALRLVRHVGVDRDHRPLMALGLDYLDRALRHYDVPVHADDLEPVVREEWYRKG